MQFNLTKAFKSIGKLLTFSRKAPGPPNPKPDPELDELTKKLLDQVRELTVLFGQGVFLLLVLHVKPESTPDDHVITDVFSSVLKFDFPHALEVLTTDATAPDVLDRVLGWVKDNAIKAGFLGELVKESFKKSRDLVVSAAKILEIKIRKP